MSKRPLEHFYYHVGHATTYGWEPHGDPDLDRLINNDAPFLSSSSFFAKKSKSLILNDWRLRWGTPDLRDKIIKEIIKLIDQGFTVYALQDGILKPLQKENLALLSTDPTFQFSLYHDTHLQQYATEFLQVPSEQIQILNDHWMNYAMGISAPQEHVMRLSEIFSAIRYAEKISETYGELLTYFESTKELASQTIIDDTFSDPENISFIREMILAYFPNAQIITDYRHAVLNADEVETLLSKQHIIYDEIPSETNPVYHSHRFSEQNLSQLQSLTIKKIHSSHDLSDLIQHTSSLHELSLEKCDLAEPIQSTEHLQGLTKYQVIQGHISRAHLECILHASPNLEELVLIDPKNILEEKTFLLPSSLLPLKHLKKMNLVCIAEQDIQTLLNAAPQLEILSIQDQQSHGSTYNTKHNRLLPNSLPELKSLSIIDKHISVEELEELLLAAPHLEHLFLEHIMLTPPGELRLESSQLQKLKSITIKMSEIPQQHLTQLIQSTAQLESLTLRDIDLDPTALEPQLHRLKSLSFQKRYTNLSNIIRATPNLEYLSISSPHEKLELESQSLPSLTFFEISKPNLISGASIKNMAPKLCYASPNDEENVLKCSAFKFIEKIHPSIFHMKESAVSFRKVLKTSPAQESTQIPAPASTPTPAPAPAPAPAPSVIKTEELSFEQQIQLHQHNTEDLYTFKPNTQKKLFQNLTTKSQAMIVDKLCHYVSLKKLTVEKFIPNIQDGICLSLSHYYLNMRSCEFDQFLSDTEAWQGDLDQLSEELRRQFDDLLEIIQQDYIKPLKKIKAQYISGKLAEILRRREPYILSNPWHSIAIRPDEHDDNAWFIYDPNSPRGAYHFENIENFLQGIDRLLGPIVSIDSEENPNCEILNPDLFIQHGGLIILNRYENIIQNFSQLVDHQYTKDALKGLLLRDTLGAPAWIKIVGSIKSKWHPLFVTIFQQFKEAYPEDWQERLYESTTGMSQKKRESYLELFIEHAREYSDLLPEPLAEMHEVFIKKSFLHPETSHAYHVKVHALHYLQENTVSFTKRLIQVNTEKEIEALRFTLEKMARDTHRPIYYIHTPEDIVCAKKYISFIDNAIHEGPGGPLYRFIEDNKGYRPIFLINYNNFTANDIVRLNDLLDPKPAADGTPLYEHTTIVGMLNRHDPDTYQGSDFYSRFQEIIQCDIPLHTLQEAIPKLQLETPQEEQDFFTIKLYKSQNWKKILLGGWTMQDNHPQFKQGILSEALLQNKPLLIHNGLWEDDEFQRFWKEARLKGEIDCFSKKIPFPKELKIYHQEGYEWQTLQTTYDVVEKVTSSTFILTHLSYTKLFQNYTLKDGIFSYKEGLIYQASLTEEKALHLHLTHSPDQHVWAHILETCQQFGVKLQCTLSQNVIIPPHKIEMLQAPLFKSWDEQQESSTLLIETPNSAQTITMLGSDWLVIDISECQGKDLLTRVEPLHVAPDQQFHRFEEIVSDMIERLNRGEKIILTGRFSETLSQELAPFLYQRILNNPSGKLALVSENLSFFQYLDPVKHHTPASTIKPQAPSQFIFHPKNDLDLTDLTDFNDFDKQSTANANAFITEECQAILEVLHRAPYAYVLGPSGAGKTTLITQTLTTPNDHLFQDESSLLAWVNDKEEIAGYKYLFIDEANVHGKDWTDFEGLFQKPPHLFYKGKLYPLSEKHKVIFAGNPMSYGAGRNQPRLFTQPGRENLIVNVEPLSLSTVYEKTLKPIFDKHPFTKNPDYVNIIHSILEAYSYICDNSVNDILISPRELQTVALLFCDHYTRYPDDIPSQVVYKIIEQVMSNCLPQEKQEDFLTYCKEKIHYDVRRTHLLLENSTCFLVTPSRQSTHEYLVQLLELRETRQHESQNDAQLYGGLGGLIIEGEPSAGKSELVIATLRANNYQEVHDLKTPAQSNTFYRLHANYFATHTEEEIKTFFIDAFDAGMIVVIDEINAFPMPESIFNHLLMGRKPNGEKPKNPGFMLIGTQNPSTMGGRFTVSHAISRRLHTEILPPYETTELQEILVSRGLNLEAASKYIEDYKKRCKEKGLTFTLRGLLDSTPPRKKEVPPNVMRIKLDPVPQVGAMCKTVAIASVEKYYAKLLGYKAIPLRSHHSGALSVRHIVKSNGSQQGEILEFSKWENSVSDLGFETKVVDFNDNFELFFNSIVENLQHGNLPLITFAVDEDGLPDPDPTEPETREHAAIITGFHAETQKLTIVHWGESFEVDAKDLYHSSTKLTQTRSPEYYTKNPNYRTGYERLVSKYKQSTGQQLPSPDSVDPFKTGSGFRGKLLCVIRPLTTENLLRTRTQKLTEKFRSAVRKSLEVNVSGEENDAQLKSKGL